MESTARFESLHNHTTASDGTQTHLQVLKTASANGFGVMAFTDHDRLPDAGDIKKLRDFEGKMKWFVGVEVSSGLPVELGGGSSSNLHILGLFTDPTNRALLDHCAKAQVARTERMEKIIRNLHSLGLTVSVSDTLKASAGESVGRPHIVRALYMHPENAAVIEGIRAKMEKAAREDPAVAMDYAHMIERPASDYPYRLFLSSDAFIRDVYVDYLYWVDMDLAVSLIRGAGGVAVVAHWYTASKVITAELLEGMIREGRLDGVEIMGNPENPQARRAEPVVTALAERTGCISTYGIDGHRPEDIPSFASDRVLANRTVGQTQRIIDRIKPDLTWSNLA
jgi:3',5'-nucleoside bisphosphate phosphatase